MPITERYLTVTLADGTTKEVFASTGSKDPVPEMQYSDDSWPSLDEVKAGFVVCAALLAAGMLTWGVGVYRDLEAGTCNLGKTVCAYVHR